MLHNFGIHTNDPCNPQWKLSMEELELNVGNINRQQNNENQMKMQPR